MLSIREGSSAGDRGSPSLKGPGHDLTSAELENQFEIVTLPGRKGRQTTCRHCRLYRYAENRSRMKGHLSACPSYLGTRRHTPVAQQTITGMMRGSGVPTKHARDRAAALAAITSGKGLDLWEQDDIKGFLRLLQPANSSYLPPSRNTIADIWLPALYTETKELVKEKVIQPATSLNVVFDASDDISSLRQLNISVATSDRAAVFWRMIDTGSVRHTAAETARLVKDGIADLVDTPEGPDWTRINAFITDTCNSAVAAANILTEMPDLKHTFSVFCDSHGLQLLVKDMCDEVKDVKTIFESAIRLCRFVTASPLRLSKIRAHQQVLLGRSYSFLTGALTRWGSHFKTLTSLIRSKAALDAYATEVFDQIQQGEIKGQERTFLEPRIRTILREDFWAELTTVRELLQPLDNAIRSSESDRSDISKVVLRWAEVEDEWRRLQFRRPQLPWDEIWGVFAARKRRQVTKMNRLAFALDPCLHHLSEEWYNEALTLISEIGNRVGAMPQIARDFVQFRSKKGAFRAENVEWTMVSDPRTFWDSYQNRGRRELTILASRIFGCIATAVPAERSFSAMNRIKNKHSNRLTAARLDQLLFMYINTRVVKRLGQPQNDDDGSDDDENDEEEELAESALAAAVIEQDEAAFTVPTLG